MKTTRIHSLDSLRAIMMLLGLVLHSALTYNVTEHGNVWIIKDPESTSIFTDLLVLLIHSFRMPIFFLIAGFFGAMLFYERSPKRMIANRIARIVFPFLAFLCILTPIIDFSFRYAYEIFNGSETAFNTALQPFSNLSFYIPKSTSHLWFLYYLIYTTTFSVILALLAQKMPNVTKKIKIVGSWIFQRSLIRVLTCSAMTFVILMMLQTSMIASSTSLIPDTETFVYFVSFYLTGWWLYTAKQHLDTFKKHDWFCTIVAIILILMQGILIQFAELGLQANSNSMILIAFNSIIVWLFIFGITGLFIRYGSKHSKRMRYLSDASYWVYLIHLPLTAIFPTFVYKLPIGAIPKFILVTSMTSIVCFVTYHYFVRNTCIGKFLNGRKYPITDS